MKLIRAAFAVLGVVLFAPYPNTHAAEQVIEEIIVTARQQAETLQDVPVTIAALTEEDLDRYNITNLVDAAKMVPNMVISHGGSGNGSNLRLRGIGSSSISAAFDHSLAINIDGIVVNRGRFIHNSYMDMGQLEVLKGPQSLYFGKSATAGVISITTNDPGDEFEFQVSGGVETEHEGTFGEIIISGPITDTLGARLAVGFTENDELFENYSADNDPINGPVNGAASYFGDESLNTRLTVVWNPADNFQAKLKYSYSEYDNNGGGLMWYEEVCPEGAHQPTAIPAASAVLGLFQGADDCRLNGNTSKVNLNPGLRAGLPHGFSDGKPGLEQESDFVSLTMDWDINEQFTLTSVTGYVDLSHVELDDYSYGAGVFGGLHNNEYESLSQELRVASHFEGPVNFQVGLFWQEMEQQHDAYQYAFNLALVPNVLNFNPATQPLSASMGFDPTPGALFGADPVTGNEYDYNKDHYLDTDVLSAFFAVYWDINERTEITFGARYTEEEKDGYILIPYMHTAAALFGFGAPPRIDGLKFDDDNLSPEFAINYYLNDDVSVFAAYKEGFKSGGIDNSALPTAALNPAVNGGDFGFLEYESEESKGYEIGLKAHLLDGSMRLNATYFDYEYSDLQVQLFDSAIIQYQTFNASALDTSGVEFDILWNTEIEGLSIRTAWSWTDTEYAEDFINATGQNLRGQEREGNAEISGFIGATWEFPVSDTWAVSLSADARYSDDYGWTATLDPYVQDNYWVVDAAISLHTQDYRHQFNLVGRNLGDEFYVVSGGAIPGRCANFSPTPAPTCNSLGSNSLDQNANTQLGRTISLQYRFTL